MKELNNHEISQISGATQYLVLTSTVEFEGIPAECVDNYFQSNANLATIDLETIGNEIIKSCPAFIGVTSYSYTTAILPIAVALMTE